MIVFNQKPKDDSERIANLQTSLATVYSQMISLRESLAEREAQISRFQDKNKPQVKEDHTLTVIQVLFKLYQLLLLPKGR